jgi:hypothetical protein
VLSVRFAENSQGPSRTEIKLLEAPNANALADRGVGASRRDCLDWVVIASCRQLERVLGVYVEHYGTHRRRHALGLRSPAPEHRLHLVGSNPPDEIQRRKRLGGLIHE